MRIRTPALLLLALGLSLPAGAETLTTAVIDFINGDDARLSVVNAGAVDTMVTLTIRDAAGNAVAGPLNVTVVAGQAQTLPYDVTFAGPKQLYGEILCPSANVPLRGNLKRVDGNGRTLEDSDATIDVVGALAALEQKDMDLMTKDQELMDKDMQLMDTDADLQDQIDALEPSTPMVTRIKTGNLGGSWAGVNQGVMLTCAEGEVAIAGGWKANDATVTVRDSRIKPGTNGRTWEFKFRRAAGGGSDFLEASVQCLKASYAGN